MTKSYPKKPDGYFKSRYLLFIQKLLYFLFQSLDPCDCDVDPCDFDVNNGMEF